MPNREMSSGKGQRKIYLTLHGHVLKEAKETFGLCFLYRYLCWVKIEKSQRQEERSMHNLYNSSQWVSDHKDVINQFCPSWIPRVIAR
jgi:hypothetical protein